MYNIVWKRSAKKELKRIDRQFIPAIIEQVGLLAEEPHPENCKKLVNTDNVYRIRIGDYRVCYTVDAGEVVIQIVRVGHRKNVYSKL